MTFNALPVVYHAAYRQDDGSIEWYPIIGVVEEKDGQLTPVTLDGGGVISPVTEGSNFVGIRTIEDQNGEVRWLPGSEAIDLEYS